ncbi:MAG: hypothetical protein R3E93_08935 [Thiothrix sp.]
MPDGKTAYMGDDGTHGFMLMFVADKAGDLSAGTIYAAKWTQTSADAGGAANLTWIKLGSSTDAEIKALADTLEFTDIFDAVAPTPAVAPATIATCDAGYTRIRAGSTADECLKVKAGQKKLPLSWSHVVTQHCWVRLPSSPKWKVSRSMRRTSASTSLSLRSATA